MINTENIVIKLSPMLKKLKLKEWLIENKYDSSLFIKSTFPIQLGVLLQFLQSKNLQLLADNASWCIYPIDPIQYSGLVQATKSPYIKYKWSGEMGDVLDNYYEAVVAAITHLYKPF